MNNKLLFFATVTVLLFSACRKEGDTIINNYGTENGNYPKRTMLKGYGLIDSSQTIRFNYQNNQIGKLKELFLFNSGTPSSKYIVLFDGSDKPVGYQSYTLPANTLNEQGTFKLDAEGRIIEVIKRKVNGDTIGISYFQYANVDYQPTSFFFYDKTTDRNTVYEYYTYDKSGNLLKATSYKDNGTDPLYKESETEASGFGKGINNLNQIYYYIATLASSYGISSSATLYFSSYMPTSTRTQYYKVDGTSQSVSISNMELGVDNNNNIVTFKQSGTSQTIYFQY